MKYIAYGSNMVESQMAHRCPNAKLIGMGYLPNHRLEFYLHATVERSQAKGAKVPVAVWEGVPTYYTKQRRKVIMHDASEIYGMVYIMKMIRPAPPAARYYDAIADAYADLGIGSEIARVLEPALQRSKQRSRFSIR